jgi:hypothetical protein
MAIVRYGVGSMSAGLQPMHDGKLSTCGFDA